MIKLLGNCRAFVDKCDVSNFNHSGNQLATESKLAFVCLLQLNMVDLITPDPTRFIAPSEWVSSNENANRIALSN